MVVAESQQSASIYSLLQQETNSLVTSTRALEGFSCVCMCAGVWGLNTGYLDVSARPQRPGVVEEDYFHFR